MHNAEYIIHNTEKIKGTLTYACHYFAYILACTNALEFSFQLWRIYKGFTPLQLVKECSSSFPPLSIALNTHLHY